VHEMESVGIVIHYCIVVCHSWKERFGWFQRVMIECALQCQNMVSE